MSYKTILVHVDDSRYADARIRLAARIALQEGAHLIGAATTGVSSMAYGTLPLAMEAPGIAPYLEVLSERGDKALERFGKIAENMGVPSYEKRKNDDDAGVGISLQGRYADLVVLGQHNPDDPAMSSSPDFPEYVVMTCGRPVLIVPYVEAVAEPGKRILVAWNESAESAKAVANALPLLKQAAIVEVALVEPESGAGAGEGEGKSGVGIRQYLDRHGIPAEIRRQKTPLDAGNALLNLSAELGSDLLVMGCYGHTRIREILLGGATRTILQSMTVPVLMSH